jgi:hypothetical protein
LWRCVALAEPIEPFRVEISQTALDAERRQAADGVTTHEAWGLGVYSVFIYPDPQ